MDAETKNRFVLERIAKRLERDGDFHGTITLNCKGGRIVRHTVEESHLTEELISENGGGDDGA